MERLEGNFSNDFECLWAKISTSNSVFHIAVVYHPPEPQYNADNLNDFLANTCNDILVSDPNSKLIICGDLINYDTKTCFCRTHCFNWLDLLR